MAPLPALSSLPRRRLIWPSASGTDHALIQETGAAAGHTIITQSADKIHGMAVLTETGTVTQVNTQSLEDGAGVNKVHFKSDGTAVGGQAGNTCRLVCIEKGKWVATVHASTSATVGAAVTILAN